MNTEEIDPRLVGELAGLGRTFGPLGVALAAAELTDTAALIDCLQQRQADEEDPGPYARGPHLAAPSVARIVHYVSEDGDCQAAIVTGVGPHPHADGTVHMTVFYEVGFMLALDVPHAEDKAVGAERHPAGTWHWPERVEGPARPPSSGTADRAGDDTRPGEGTRPEAGGGRG